MNGQYTVTADHLDDVAKQLNYRFILHCKSGMFYRCLAFFFEIVLIIGVSLSTIFICITQVTINHIQDGIDDCSVDISPLNSASHIELVTTVVVAFVTACRHTFHPAMSIHKHRECARKYHELYVETARMANECRIRQVVDNSSDDGSIGVVKFKQTPPPVTEIGDTAPLTEMEIPLGPSQFQQDHREQLTIDPCHRELYRRVPNELQKELINRERQFQYSRIATEAVATEFDDTPPLPAFFLRFMSDVPEIKPDVLCVYPSTHQMF